MGWMIVAAWLFVLALVMACCRVSGESHDQWEQDYAPPPPTAIPLEEEPRVEVGPAYLYDDVVELAKIMQAEAGVDWPDWAVMCIGEVVLNRVASSDFPDTIHDVLHQVDPVQYEPVHTGAWESMEPDEDYIDLARRLLDGERVLNNPDVVWQALFPQGDRTVMTFHDKILNTTTYFCE
jgi:hypothetical protein